MPSARSIVVGTAGHIDHGKTCLIHALTGMDTDRLAEEKRRGISIDLGFAHLVLPGGGQISFIDVPGHERFIRNMLAGTGGIEAVLLVVAADESIKPQTREHFEICRLLGVRRGIVAISKTDLVSPEQLAATRASVQKLTAGTFLASAPAIPVSAVTGTGLDVLEAALTDLLTNAPAHAANRLMRLPVDRSFALKGFGAVVTGTLWSGSLRVGDPVELQPAKLQARVRGIQVNGRSVPVAVTGQRTAVNLNGVDYSHVRRGFVMAAPNKLEPTTLLDASADWLGDVAVPNRREVFLFHIGTTEVEARLAVLSDAGDADRSFIRIKLDKPVIALPGDRFVLRRPSPSETIGGGSVIDPFPPKRLNRARTRQRLERLKNATLGDRLHLLASERENGRKLDVLVRLTGQEPEQIRSAIENHKELTLIGPAQTLVTTAWLNRRRSLLIKWLESYHAQNTSAKGAPVSQARLGLEPALAAAVFGGFNAVRIEGDFVSLATHSPKLADRDAAALSRIEQEFKKAGAQPPPTNEILSRAEPNPRTARDFLEKLIKGGQLVRVSTDLVFHAQAITQIRKTLAPLKGRRFSVPEFKEWTQVSRKYAIPLLEYFDHQRVTKREGDSRVVL